MRVIEKVSAEALAERRPFPNQSTPRTNSQRTLTMGYEKPWLMARRLLQRVAVARRAEWKSLSFKCGRGDREIKAEPISLIEKLRRAAGLESQSAFNQPRSEALALGRQNGRAVPLLPSQGQTAGPLVPSDIDPSVGDGKSPIFGGVGCQFMECHPQRNGKL